MKITLEFKEGPRGDVEFSMRAEPGLCTAREKSYLEATVELMRKHVPIMGKELGAKAAIFSDPKANPKNS